MKTEILPQIFSTLAIEMVFNKKNINISFKEFIDTLIIEENIVKQEQEAKIREEKSKIYIDEVYPPLDFGITIEDYIKNIIDNEEWYDVFADDDFPDEGIDENFYYMVGEKLYMVELHCDAEWCGDWSVRANLPGDVSVSTITEIEHFEILNKKKNSVTVKLK